MSTTTTLSRSLAAEWTRLWTVRSTWWFLAATAVMMVGLGALLGLDVAEAPPSERPDDPAWVGGLITSMPGQFGLLALVALAVTGEHGTRGIVPTLQWTPRRGILFTARAAVLVVTATALGVVLTIAASVAAWAFVPELGLPLGEGVELVGRAALVFGAGAALAVGLGLLLRNVGGGLVTVFMLMLVLPLMLPVLGFEWAETLAELMPGMGAVDLLLGEIASMSDREAVVLLLAWALAALVAGAWRLLRTDADR